MNRVLTAALLGLLNLNALNSLAAEDKVAEGKAEVAESKKLTDAIQKSVRETLEKAGLEESEIAKILDQMKSQKAHTATIKINRDSARSQGKADSEGEEETAEAVVTFGDTEVIKLGEMDDLLSMVVKINDSAAQGSIQYRIGVQVKEDTANSDTPKVIVERVLKASPAEKAGIAKGDLITSVNGKPIASPSELLVQLQELGKEGVDVNISALRGDETLEFTLKPEKLPDVHQSIAEAFNRPEFKQGWIGGFPMGQHFGHAAPSETSNKEVIERLDKIEKEINELKDLVKSLAK